MTASDQLHQDRVEELIRGNFVENNYAALKIIDVDIFIFFYFIKISFPVHFLFKWRQNLSARPRTSINKMLLQFINFLQEYLKIQTYF